MVGKLKLRNEVPLTQSSSLMLEKLDHARQQLYLRDQVKANFVCLSNINLYELEARSTISVFKVLVYIPVLSGKKMLCFISSKGLFFVTHGNINPK